MCDVVLLSMKNSTKLPLVAPHQQIEPRVWCHDGNIGLGQDATTVEIEFDRRGSRAARTGI